MEKARIKRVINSLKTAKIMDCGQRLLTLAFVAFGESFDRADVKEVQKLLRVFTRKGFVLFHSPNRVWALTEKGKKEIDCYGL